MTGYEAARPFARARINPEGIFSLNAWSSDLIGLGPRNRLLAGRPGNTLIADLSIDHTEGGNELVVKPISGELGDAALAKLIAWAEEPSHAGVWLPDQVLDVEPTAVLVGDAWIRRPTGMPPARIH